MLRSELGQEGNLQSQTYVVASPHRVLILISRQHEFDNFWLEAGPIGASRTLYLRTGHTG